MIYFAHVKVTSNAGDKRCCPYYYYESYFRQFNCQIVNLTSLRHIHIDKQDIIIIGGGGILDASRQWNDNIIYAMHKTKNIILWGCGYNNNGKINFNSIPINKTLLAGIRDYQHPYLRFVPCPSCKSVFFDRIKPVNASVGIIKHYGNTFTLNDSYNGIDCILNSASMQEIVNFIHRHSIILSDSYHGLYWASLAGKKVGRLDNRNNSRFRDCFYQYPYIQYLDDADNAQAFTLTGNDLAFFRQLNDCFFLQVKSIIEK